MKEYSGLMQWFIDKLGLSKKTIFKDIAPWVGQLIEQLEKQPNVELFSVSPQIKMSKRVESFKKGNTTYYFYSPEFSSALRLLKNYKVWKMLQNCGRRVCYIAQKIKPDVVIAYGTENPVTSVPQLSLYKHYPVLCVLQTIYNNPDRIKYSKPSRLIQDLEHDIINNISYFGTEDKLYYDLLKEMNKDVCAFEFKYPCSPLPEIEITEKKFDFVNFAYSMGLKKGDDDSIKALAIVTKKYPEVSLNIAGGLNPLRKEYLEKLVKEYGLQNNVSFTPLFERKEDMYRHVLQARFAVLPVKLDLVSTTTKEAMYYGLPVITNITPETPELNKEKQCVLLAEKGNIESLAKCMIEVLENEQLADTLAENGREYMEKQISNSNSMTRQLDVLKVVVENYNNGTAVPVTLLFNGN